MSKDCPEPRRERGERGGDRGGYKRQRNDDGGSNRRFDNANDSAWNAEKQLKVRASRAKQRVWVIVK